MALDSNEATGQLKGILWPDERVELAVEQRRVGPGGSVTTPTTVAITDRRLIILNRATLGIRKDYEVIPYARITSVRLERGIISSSVFIRVEGYDRDKGLLKGGDEEGEIDGLRGGDAAALADSLNKKVNIKQDTSKQNEATGQQQRDGSGAYVFCSSCGARCGIGAKFCSSCGAPMQR